MRKKEINYKNKKNYTDLFYYPEISCAEFINLLLRYLYDNGVTEIKEEELSKKLYVYYEEPKYNKIFAAIVKAKNEEKVDICDAIYIQKYFTGCVWWTINFEDILQLNYGEDSYTTKYEEKYNKDIILLLRELANNLSVIYKEEKKEKVIKKTLLINN